uniref:Uncharacterized protein n=1 Tax=Strigamia maritima TaxID=126957 RepID=T1JFZ1_STRMM
MATAVKSQIVPLAGCSQTKPPVPPKPLPGERKKPERKKSDPNISESSLPVGEMGYSNQAIALAQQLRLKNSNAASTGEAKPSTSKTTKSNVTPAAGIKRSQSSAEAKPKTTYVLKPLRQHHSFQEAKTKKPHIKRRSRDDGDKSSKIRDWFCLPLASFVVKTKDGGSSLVEKGKGRLFGKTPTKKRAPEPPASDNLIPSRPKVPPRPVLQRILADIDTGKGAGKWHKLENVKYIDEEVTTEDSTDYSDVDWGQAIHSAPGEESIIYYTYVEEGLNEKVIFYRSVPHDEVISSSEEEEADERPASHVAQMEDMEIEVEIEVPEKTNGLGMNGHGEEPIVDEQIIDEESPIRQMPIEVEVIPKVEVSDMSQSPELHKNLSVIVEEEEAVKSPPPRPPSPRLPTSVSSSPILRMLSRTPSPRPDTPREPTPVIIYEKFETKVKIVEENIPLVDNTLPLNKNAAPETNEPEYARIQKYSPPKNIESEQIETFNENKVIEEPSNKNETYYDLDVAELPQKVKPQRPPRPLIPPPSPPRLVMPSLPPPPKIEPRTPPPAPPVKVVPPPPPKLAPPPVPPKTYMKIQFPPKNEVEEYESVVEDDLPVDMKPIEEIMQVESRDELGVSETTIVAHEEHIDDLKLESIGDVEAAIEMDVNGTNLMPDDIKDETDGFLEKSHMSLGEGSEVSDDKLRSVLGLNETSESGFMSSPTPPPRNRRKRFRSMEGPARGSLGDVSVPVPLRRSKSVSESENRKSWNSEPSASRMSTPKPPQTPTIKPKPARPPKPKITSVRQLKRSSEPDLASIVSSGNGSPPLIRMKERPLPPPPTPPRHRFPFKGSDRDANAVSKTPESMQMPISSNFPFEFLAKLSEIEAGKLNLTEINVKRINVQEIQADVVRTGSLEVGVVPPLIGLIKGKSDDDDDDDDDSGNKNKESKEKSEDFEAINENIQDKCDKVLEETEQKDFGGEDGNEKVIDEKFSRQEETELLQEVHQERDSTDKNVDKKEKSPTEGQ